jgi:hypothetical protein
MLGRQKKRTSTYRKPHFTIVGRNFLLIALGAVRLLSISREPFSVVLKAQESKKSFSHPFAQSQSIPDFFGYLSDRIEKN